MLLATCKDLCKISLNLILLCLCFVTGTSPTRRYFWLLPFLLLSLVVGFSSSAKIALLVAPHDTHPQNLALFQNHMQLLQHYHSRMQAGEASQFTQLQLMHKKLHQLQRLDRPHWIFAHQDLNYLQCLAWLIQQCRGLCDQSLFTNFVKSQ